ncbi:MAG: hypothetical protein L0H29_08850 [Sinobacteraceae bacterium]|nr:hypothetical protein [Nevskiaceae bacterium]
MVIGIGMGGAHAGTFLQVVGVVMILALLPMALWPLQWARVVGWKIPADNHLAIYYGRCLGAVASATGAFAIVASAHAATTAFYFPFLLTLWVLMVLAHAWGGLRRIQPLSETCEIVFWGGLAVLTLAFWPIA